MRERLEQLRVMAAEFAEAPLWSLQDGDSLELLDLVHRAEQTLAAVKLHLIREAVARDLPALDRAHSGGAWLGATGAD